MSIDTIYRGIQAAAGEPLRFTRGQVCALNLSPTLIPRQKLIRQVRPEAVRIGKRTLVHRLVGLWRNVCVAKVVGNRVNVGVAHALVFLELLSGFNGGLRSGCRFSCSSYASLTPQRTFSHWQQ